MICLPVKPRPAPKADSRLQSLQILEIDRHHVDGLQAIGGRGGEDCLTGIQQLDCLRSARGAQRGREVLTAEDQRIQPRVRGDLLHVQDALGSFHIHEDADGVERPAVLQLGCLDQLAGPVHLLEVFDLGYDDPVRAMGQDRR